MLCDCGKCTAVRNDMSIFLHNLLARIHRDGGHYTATHGLDKSVADADKIIADLYVTRDALTSELHEAYRRKDKSDTECDALQAQLDNANNELLQADDELAAARFQLAALATREPSEGDHSDFLSELREINRGHLSPESMVLPLWRFVRDALLSDVPAPAPAPIVLNNDDSVRYRCEELGTVTGEMPECGYIDRPSPSEAAKATCERCNPKGKRK